MSHLSYNCFTLFCALFVALQFAAAQVDRPVGTNLSGIEDWSSEYVFVDVFNQCRAWIPHEYGSNAPWSSNVNIPLRSDGYPIEIPYNNGIDPPQAIRTLMFFGALQNKYPSGYYRLKAEGSGQIRLRFAANGTFKCPVDTLVWVNSSLGGFALEIDTSLAADPVRAINFIMPGFHQTYVNHPYHPDLLDFIADFQVLRFMDWMKTNASPVRSWSDRNPLDYYTQTLDRGVAYEHIVNLCNLTQKDAWICVPHRADDTYITQLAQFFRDSLDPALKVYIEYSNEVWNGAFAQSAFADSSGAALGYQGNPWEQGWQFYAKRTADVLQIFEAVFAGSPNRLVNVISSQAANSWLSNYIVEKFQDSTYNPTQVQANALAIAPYFAGSVANDIGDAGMMNTVSVNDILDSMQFSLPQALNWMDAAKTVADTHNLLLIAYEGGQHLVASPLYHNDTAFVNKLTAANRHPDMQQLYCSYFNNWYDSTQADLFCNFSSHGVYSKYGSWGVKEYMDDSLSPKYIALQNCIFSYNNPIINNFNPPTSSENLANFMVYPNPTATGHFTIEHNFKRPNIRLFNTLGQEIECKTIEHTDYKTYISLPHYQGYALLLIEENGVFYTRKIICAPKD